MTYLFCRANDAKAINEYHYTCKNHQSILVKCLYRRKFANVEYDHIYLPPCDQYALKKNVHFVKIFFDNLLSSIPPDIEYMHIEPQYIRLDRMPINDAKIAAAKIHYFLSGLFAITHSRRDAKK